VNREVKHNETDCRGIFFIEDAGKKIAAMHYHLDQNVLTIEHTVVDPSFEGQGLGKLLITAVTDFARTNSYKIVPVCPYAKKVLERSDQYHDLLLKE
jgi:predicted GNAT family acetyltransferase